MFSIFFQSGKIKKKIKVESNYTIAQAIQLLKEKINSTKLISVIFNSKPLDPNKTLEFYGIKRHDVLQYSDNYKGGSDNIGIDMAVISNPKGLVQKNYSKDAKKGILLQKG